MDSFEFNKIAMAVLAVIFGVFSVSLISEAVFHSEVPQEQAFVISEGDTAEDAADGEPEGPAFEPVAPIMASADASAGEAVFKKCVSCHTVENGGQNKVGPNLWNIINRPIASHEGFSYSAALQEYGEGKEWTYEELNGFLWKPKTYVRGTAMGFVGLRDVEDRADVIAYLRTFADTPAPLPEPVAPTAETQENGEQTDTAESQTESSENDEENANDNNGNDDEAESETPSQETETDE
jgi:cytochrome c